MFGARQIADRLLALPVYPTLSDADVERIGTAFVTAAVRYRSMSGLRDRAAIAITAWKRTPRSSTGDTERASLDRAGSRC